MFIAIILVINNYFDKLYNFNSLFFYVNCKLLQYCNIYLLNFQLFLRFISVIVLSFKRNWKAVLWRLFIQVSYLILTLMKFYRKIWADIWFKNLRVKYMWIYFNFTLYAMRVDSIRYPIFFLIDWSHTHFLLLEWKINENNCSDLKKFNVRFFNATTLHFLLCWEL